MFFAVGALECNLLRFMNYKATQKPEAILAYSNLKPLYRRLLDVLPKVPTPLRCQ